MLFSLSLLRYSSPLAAILVCNAQFFSQSHQFGMDKILFHVLFYFEICEIMEENWIVNAADFLFQQLPTCFNNSFEIQIWCHISCTCICGLDKWYCH